MITLSKSWVGVESNLKNDGKIPYERQKKSSTSNAKEYFDIDFKRQKNLKKKKIGINDDTDGAHWLYYTPSAIHVHVFFIYKNKMLTKVKNKKKKKKK